MYASAFRRHRRRASRSATSSSGIRSVSCSSRFSAEAEGSGSMKVALLTGGKDPHYARGLARELATKGIHVALIGSPGEMVRGPQDGPGRVELHDLVGSQNPDAGLPAKVGRVVTYYVRLLGFAATTDARLFHILWFRRFPRLERVLLTMYLTLLRKTVVVTAHNVDGAMRDGRGRPFIERFSLRFLYSMVAHIFVHTDSMK